MSMRPDRLELTALSDMPLVAAGDDLAELIADALQGSSCRRPRADSSILAPWCRLNRRDDARVKPARTHGWWN